MESTKENIEKASGLLWNISPASDPHKREALTDAVENLHPIVADLLLQRNINSYEKVRNFFNPSLDTLEKLGEMRDLQKATGRVLEAFKKGEKILLYGDYDVDGTCSVAMMYLFLKKIGANVTYYIPDRYDEGYGISEKGVVYASDEKNTLLITLDCGIAACDRIAQANNLGIDCIICDHHLPGLEIPAAFAILNPQHPECTYDGLELCGCGVGFILLREICKTLGLQDDIWESYLGFVAVATCCDIVPLTGINRALVFAGLQVLDAAPPPGISALLQVAAFNESLTVSDVVFKIGPRINAAGRLKHASLAVELLIKTDIESASPLAEEIEKLNLHRRVLDKQITAEAVQQMKSKDPVDANSSTVVFHKDWHKGVIGIIASRLTEVCYRPTVVLTESNGMLTGSARSVEGFNLFEAISACSESLVQFGGHHSAAGLTLEPEKIKDFENLFEAAVQNRLHNHDQCQRLHIDLELELTAWYNDRFSAFIKQLARLGPFGPANMEPVFATKNCRAKFVQVLKNEHVKFSVFHESAPKNALPVIAFQQADHYENLISGKPFSLAYTICERVWNGRTSIQLQAKDIKF